MHQTWRDLLFLHWKIEPALVQATLPPGLRVDTFEGDAYLGLVPFFMQGIRPRSLPAVRGLSNFLEMNVRTYAFDEHGRAGVWFYSLDANQPLAVTIAKNFFHLPYFRADMRATHAEDGIRYRCSRREASPRSASVFHYAGGNRLPAPEPGSLEFFLLERYLLFAYRERDKTLFSGQVHHNPYTLRQARLANCEETATSQAGFDVSGREPDHVAFSPGVDVHVFRIQPVATAP